MTFALPIVEAPAAGGGSLPRQGSLLPVELHEGQLSNIRRRGDHREARIWNPSRRPVRARLAGVDVDLGPAKIATVPV